MSYNDHLIIQIGIYILFMSYVYVQYILKCLNFYITYFNIHIIYLASVWQQFRCVLSELLKHSTDPKLDPSESPGIQWSEHRYLDQGDPWGTLQISAAKYIPNYFTQVSNFGYLIHGDSNNPSYFINSTNAQPHQSYKKN